MSAQNFLIMTIRTVPDFGPNMPTRLWWDDITRGAKNRTFKDKNNP